MPFHLMKPLPVILIVLALALAAGCGGSGGSGAGTTSAAPAPVEPFAYNRTAPLKWVDRGVINPSYPIKVHDVSFTSGGKKIDGLLAVPPGKGPFPAVLYLHGSGGDRSELIVPATWMAAHGVVALTITLPQGQVVAGATPEEQLKAQRRIGAATVVAARRAVDALQALPQVKRDRIGLVGYSAGGKIGAILAGVERRIGAFDLISAGSPPVSDYAEQAPEALRPVVIRELEAVDPLRWVKTAGPGTILLQDGRKDEVVPQSALKALAKAAGAAAELRWYDGGHAPGNKVWTDQLRWMAAKLGVDGPVVKGARSGP
jgi:dienelactone hydrolase